MRLPEQKLWDRLSSMMVGSWDACRIESRVEKSAPDVYFSNHEVHGWLELKVYQPPTRSSTKFAIRSWTAGQQAWARRFSDSLTSVWLVVHFAGTQKIYVLGAPDALAAQNAISVEEFESRFRDQCVHWLNRDPHVMLDVLQESWFNSCVAAAMAPRTLKLVPKQ